MKTQVSDLISNANTTAESLAMFTSNLNQRGVWSVLWKHKDKGGPATNAALRSPRARRD